MKSPDFKMPTLKQQLKMLPDCTGHSPQPQQFDQSAQAWSLESAQATKKAAKLWDIYLSENVDAFFSFIEAEPPTSLVLYRLLRLALCADNPEKPSQMGKAKAQAFEQKLEPLQILLLEAWAKNKVGPKKKSKELFARQFHKSDLAKSFGASLTWVRRSLRNQ